VKALSTSSSVRVDALRVFEESVAYLTLYDKCALMKTDARTLLSDLDKEYLTHAMAMMRANEISKVDEEVREIAIMVTSLILISLLCTLTTVGQSNREDGYRDMANVEE
jgi:hypothetical protein